MKHSREGEEHQFFDHYSEEKPEELSKRKRIKRMLEDKLERKRLLEECKDEFDELDGEFDWSDWDSWKKEP